MGDRTTPGPDEDAGYDPEQIAEVLNILVRRTVYELCHGRRPLISVTPHEPRRARSGPRRPSAPDRLLSDVLSVAGAPTRMPNPGAASLSVLYACKEFLSDIVRHVSDRCESLSWTGQVRLPEPLSSVSPEQLWAQPKVWGHHLKYALEGIQALYEDAAVDPETGGQDASRAKEGSMEPVELDARRTAMRLFLMKTVAVTIDESMVAFMNASVRTG